MKRCHDPEVIGSKSTRVELRRTTKSQQMVNKSNMYLYLDIENSQNPALRWSAVIYDMHFCKPVQHLCLLVSNNISHGISFSLRKLHRFKCHLDYHVTEDVTKTLPFIKIIQVSKINFQ